MKFGVYQNDKGDYYASIEREGPGGSVLDEKVCGSQEEAIALRDRAALAAALSFDDLPGESGEKPADPFDHDGDGKPGGSKPRKRRK